MESPFRGLGFMLQDNNHLVLQCYGSEGIFHECTYALMSLSRLYTTDELASLPIWLYTDKPEWFRALKDCPLQLHYRTIDSDLIRQWRGKIDFLHRIKIEALIDFAKEHSGNVIYSDTDVVYTRRIDELFNNIAAGHQYMHVMEDRVSNRSNPILTKLDDYLKTDPSMQVNGRPINELAMWNAGILGFSTKDKSMLDDVLTFTDKHYPKFPKHIVEQFAFSVRFQQTGAIKAASPYIIHYWNMKEVRLLLASFFATFKDRPWNELVRLADLIQLPVLMQEKVNFLHNRSIMDKLKKMQWQPTIPDWTELMKQL